jgi:hypothetical protein
MDIRRSSTIRGTLGEADGAGKPKRAVVHACLQSYE